MREGDAPKGSHGPVPGLPDQIHLSWAHDPATSFSVVWHTGSQENPATVEYRVAGQGAWQRISGVSYPSPGKGILHRVDVLGLEPNTVYEYRVSADAGASLDMSQVFKTRTPPPTGSHEDFDLVFFCDTGLIGRPDGLTNGTRQVMDEIKKDAPLFLLGGGDYAYGNKDGRFEAMGDAIDEWFRQWQPVLPWQPLMAQYGNHEIRLRECFDDWAPRFAHPQGHAGGRSYSFDVGDVHFAAFFNPCSAVPLEPDHVAWLERDLAMARQRGVRWLIVFQHAPVYGHGSSHPAHPEHRAALVPIFERYGVDLHLSGHDQNYERTLPLRHPNGIPTPGSQDRSHYSQGSGVIYAKVSPAGKKSERGFDFSHFTTEQQPFMAVRDDTMHHYAIVAVHGHGELEVTTYGVTGDGSPRKVIDHFVITAAPAR